LSINFEQQPPFEIPDYAPGIYRTGENSKFVFKNPNRCAIAATAIRALNRRRDRFLRKKPKPAF